MELEKSPIWADIRKIISDGPKQIRYTYTATIHTEKKDTTVLKIKMIDIVRDYVNNIGDVSFIELLIPLGDYIKEIYPYRTNLELTLKRQALLESGDTVKEGTTIDEERFKAVFLPDENSQALASDYAKFDQQSLNLLNIQTVKFQLINRALEALRIKTTGGIFKKVKIGDVIQSIMSTESGKILVDGKPAIDGIEMVTPDNTDVRRHVIIPQGTLISGVPTYCQEMMNGVYNAGIGTYLQTYNQKRLWFVFPLYSTIRFKENVNKAIFYGTPSHRYTAIERTYRKQGTSIYILATSNKKYSDEAETSYIDKGVGFRMTDARAMMKKPVEITEKGPVGKRGNLNNEVSIKSRDDGLNFAPVSDRSISSNPYAQYSRVLQRKGGTLALIWENADIREIYPGMPCKYITMVEDKVKEFEGIVLFCHGISHMENKGVMDRAYRMQCQITLFVDQSSD